VTLAERRLYESVSAALARALRAPVPAVRAASAPALPGAAAVPAVSSQQAVFPVGSGDTALVQVAVPAGAEVIPNVIEVPDAPAGPSAGFGGNGFGGVSGPVSLGTSTPVSVATPITVDTPVRQSTSNTQGFQLFGRRRLLF
jgi:hypothetical protein